MARMRQAAWDEQVENVTQEQDNDVAGTFGSQWSFSSYESLSLH